MTSPTHILRVIYPRVQYQLSDGTNHMLDFEFPPTSKPLLNASAQRTDTFSTAGVRQSVVIRDDRMFSINMPTIRRGDHVGGSAQWMSFLAHARSGGTFTYWPDRDNTVVSYQCFLVEKDTKLDYVAFGLHKWSGTFQVEVSA